MTLPPSAVDERVRELTFALRALLEATEDAMETVESARSWAVSGDMRGYLETARLALKEEA